MYTLYLIGEDGEKELHGEFRDKRNAKAVGKRFKKFGMAKKYRIKKRLSPKQIRARKSRH